MPKPYGIPYKGSKNAIAEKLIDTLPEADVFVDLFAGGCAMAHCALESGKYKRVIINDINPMPTQLFMDAVNGKYANEKRWISREDFFRLKDTDPYVKYCWSFGNNGEDYMYARDIEELKHAFHIACYDFDNTELKRLTGIEISGDTPSARHTHFMSLVRTLLRETMPTFKGLQSLYSLQRLQSLYSLQRLQSLYSLQRLQSDYRAVEIPPNSVVYCDIPYKDTNAPYVAGFDYDAFYEWAASHPCYISEYQAPFECIAEIKRHSHASATGHEKNGNIVTERLFCTGKHKASQISMFD